MIFPAILQFTLLIHHVGTKRMLKPAGHVTWKSGEFVPPDYNKSTITPIRQHISVPELVNGRAFKCSKKKFKYLGIVVTLDDTQFMKTLPIRNMFWHNLPLTLLSRIILRLY